MVILWQGAAIAHGDFCTGIIRVRDGSCAVFTGLLGCMMHRICGHCVRRGIHGHQARLQRRAHPRDDEDAEEQTSPRTLSHWYCEYAHQINILLLLAMAAV